MNSTAYIIFLLWIVIFIMLRNRQKAVIARKIIEKRKLGENTEMNELAKRFIDQECLIYTINNQILGTIKEVCDGAILVEKNGNVEAVSLDFIIRIRAYPKNKNGKKKSIVFD